MNPATRLVCKTSSSIMNGIFSCVEMILLLCLNILRRNTSIVIDSLLSSKGHYFEGVYCGLNGVELTSNEI